MELRKKIGALLSLINREQFSGSSGLVGSGGDEMSKSGITECMLLILSKNPLTKVAARHWYDTFRRVKSAGFGKITNFHNLARDYWFDQIVGLEDAKNALSSNLIDPIIFPGMQDQL